MKTARPRRKASKPSDADSKTQHGASIVTIQDGPYRVEIRHHDDGRIIRTAYEGDEAVEHTVMSPERLKDEGLTDHFS